MDLCDEPAFFRLHDPLQRLATHRAAHDQGYYAITRKTNIKDAVEAVGVPHTEVGAILVKERYVSFSYIPNPGDRILVLEEIEPLNPLRPSLLRPEPLASLRFLVDENIFALGILLRAMNCDVVQAREIIKYTGENYIDQDTRIAQFVLENGMFVLSKDRNLLKRNAITHGRLVRSAYTDDQCVEIIRLLGLNKPKAYCSRCLRCNTRLESVDKAQILHRLEPKTILYYYDFVQCPECLRIYWKGSHYEALKKRMNSIFAYAQKRVIRS